jgi:hypothetical protein
MNLYKENYASLDNINSVLEKDGFCVVPNVIPSDIIQQCRTQMWNTLTHMTSNLEVPITFENEKSYRGIYNLFPMHSMLIQYFSIGHAQYVWDIRSHENVANVFAKIWNCSTDDLIVSFDGVSIGMPPEITKRGWFRNDWFHFDQQFTNTSKLCVQGLINLN